jgi:hypothetical protein
MVNGRRSILATEWTPNVLVVIIIMMMVVVVARALSLLFPPIPPA